MFGVCFARQLDIAAEKTEGEAKIGLALLEPEQARAETEAEDVHPHAEMTRRPEVPELVDQRYDDRRQNQDRAEKKRNSPYR